MDTTTSEDGATPVAEPQQPEAEAAEVPQEPSASQENDQPNESSAEEAAQVEPAEAQADDGLARFAEAKGFDPKALSEGERKALSMAQNAEKRMHEATQPTKPNIQPPESMELSDDQNYNTLIERQNKMEMQTYVRDWFEGNPDMKEYRGDLQRIANEKPHLSNMDDVRAHFLANPEKLTSLKSEGGREALQNLAQKQQQIPPQSGATNTQAYKSAAITSKNVYDLVDKNGQDWFEKNHDAISQAMQG